MPTLRLIFNAQPHKRIVAKWLIYFGAAWILLGCVTQPTAPLPERPAQLDVHASFDAAIDNAVDDLLVQLQRLPEFQPPPKSSLDLILQRAPNAPAPVKIVVDTAVDAVTGQETIATQLLDGRLLGRASAKFPQFEVQRMSQEFLSSARYILVSTLTALPSTDPKLVRYRVNLSLADMRTSLVVAQSASLSTAVGVDSTPTPFFGDSPALTKDRIVDGQIKTSLSSVGTVVDGVYLANLTVGALIAEGSRLYDAGRHAEALRVYEVAAARPDGRQARVYNGLYLTNTQLGRTEAAEQAFGRIISLGLATNNLSIKFLFRPTSVEFLAETKASSPYPMWLKALAKEISAGKYCMSVIGHSSKTGSEGVNDRLSLSRANTIQRRLEALSPDITGRLQSVGMGFRENLIGTGSDDLRDALDRRVEFRVRACN